MEQRGTRSVGSTDPWLSGAQQDMVRAFETSARATHEARHARARALDLERAAEDAERWLQRCERVYRCRLLGVDLAPEDEPLRLGSFAHLTKREASAVVEANPALGRLVNVTGLLIP